MGTGVHEGANFAVGLAHHQYRHRRNFMGEEITDRGNLVGAADTDLFLLKDSRLLESVKGERMVDLRRYRMGPFEVDRGRFAQLFQYPGKRRVCMRILQHGATKHNIAASRI